MDIGRPDRLFQKRKLSTAPYRVRCMYCGELGDNPLSSLSESIELVKRIAPIPDNEDAD